MRSSSNCGVLPLLLTYLFANIGAKWNSFPLVLCVYSLSLAFDKFEEELEAI